MNKKGKDNEPKPQLMQIRPGQPLVMTEITEIDKSLQDISEQQRQFGKAVGATLRAYTDAAKELLDGKLSNLKMYAPLHLSQPSLVMVMCCNDGIIIRYESIAESQRPKIGIGYTTESLIDMAPKISESVVYCRNQDNAELVSKDRGSTIIFSKTSGNTGIQEELFRMVVSFNAIIEHPSDKPLPKPPSKPYCALSVRNYSEISLEIETIPDATSPRGKERIITRTPIRFPVGWDCIEVFPFIDASNWKPEYAHIWAENDLLASAVSNQQRENQFRTLDPNASAKHQLSILLQEYKQLLDSEPDREELLQKYLREHPVLLCPTQIQIWPKLALGARETDFIFKEASGDYVLLELEKSTHRLFLKNDDRSSILKHAQDQISDWKRYIEDNLSTVRNELNLVDISSNPRSLVIIGRSKYLNAKNRRSLQTIENNSPKNKIMTYDELYDNTKAIIENLFGPLWVEEGNTRIYTHPQSTTT